MSDELMIDHKLTLLCDWDISQTQCKTDLDLVMWLVHDRNEYGFLQ